MLSLSVQVAKVATRRAAARAREMDLTMSGSETSANVVAKRLRGRSRTQESSSECSNMPNRKAKRRGQKSPSDKESESMSMPPSMVPLSPKPATSTKTVPATAATEKQPSSSKRTADSILSQADTSIAPLREAATITAELRGVVLGRNDPDLSDAVLRIAARYEAVIAGQMTRVSLLEGRLMERLQQGEHGVGLGSQALFAQTSATRIGGQSRSKTFAASNEQRDSSQRPTYAVILAGERSSDELTSDQVKAKALEAASNMEDWVRVKAVRKLRGGKVAIVTKTQQEAQKIKSAPAVKAAGLKASEPKLADPLLVVSGVQNIMTEIEFTENLVRRNLVGIAKAGDEGSIKIVRRFGKAGSETCNVVFGAPPHVRNYLLKEGRLYMGWDSLRVREYESVPQCYGCGSYGHLLARCSLGRLCHNCGGEGHAIGVCTNPTRCRNCTLRGMVANHRVTSHECPCYQRECERRSNRVIG